jgi:hypothetical protein
MGLAEEYTEEWMGYWAYVAQRWQSGMFQAVHAIQKREYEPRHAISDVVAFWTDVGVATVTAWRGDAHKPLVVVFTLSTSDEIGGSETIPVMSQNLPFETPHIVWLGEVEDGEEKRKGRDLKPENLEAWLRNGRRELEIKLVGGGPVREAAIEEMARQAAVPTAPAPPIQAANQKRRPLRPTTYRALVHIGQIAIAEVFIVVEKPESLRTRRG